MRRQRIIDKVKGTSRLPAGQVTVEISGDLYRDAKAREEAIRNKAYFDSTQKAVAQTSFTGAPTERNAILAKIKNTPIDELVATNFDWMPDEFKNNFAVIHVAISRLDFKLFGRFIDKFITQDKLSDAEFMLNMVRQHGLKMLDFADPALVCDPNFMTLAESALKSSKIDHAKVTKGPGREKLIYPNTIRL